MSKIKRYDGLPRVTKIPEGGTDGAILGVNLRDASGRVIPASEVLNPASDGTRPTASTIWRLIREIPANIVKVAALAATGFTTRGGDGEWYQRTLQPGTGIDIQNGDGVAADPAISLADLANSGVGAALVKITRDTKGRVSGTSAATTNDLAEGTTNLYFTNVRADARADARITAQKGQPNGLATLGSDSKIPSAQLPAIAITETFVVSSQAAQLALTAQEGDVAVRTDISKSYIKNSGTTGTMSDWTELLAPSGSSVTEAPLDGYPYVRMSGAWEQTNSPSARFWLIEYPLLTDQAGNQLTDQAGNLLISNSPIVPPGWPIPTATAVTSTTTLQAMTLAEANALANPQDFQMVAIVDLAGGREPCWYDASVGSGTKWRRLSDRSIAS